MKQGWEIKKLHQLFDVKSSRRVHQSDWKSSGVPFYRAREVVKLARDGMVENELFISLELYDEFTKDKGAPKAGDIIVSAVGTLGQCYLVKDFDKFYFKDASVLWLENTSDVNSRYIEYAFKADSIMAQVMDGSMGATVGTLTINRAREIEIPLPPLPEQQRIVAILDEAFAAIDKAKANAEQNLKNAKELFESYLQGVFENKREGWEEKKLIEITTKIGSGATPKGGNESYKSEGISLIRSMNVHDFEFRERNLAFIDEQQAKELNNVTLQENDVLLNITGASVARCCILPKEYLPARVNQHVSIIRAKKEIIDPIFLNLLLTSKFYKDQLLFTGEQGATRQAITKAQLEVFEVAFPKSLKSQQSIVQKLDAISTETKKLESIYLKKINDLEELKKSVLQKAFAGELVVADKVAKIIPMPVKVDGISSTDLQAGIVALAMQRHDELNNANTLHHVKTEKIVHLAEYIIGIDLERNPIKDAAGPNDFPHGKKVESRAAKAGFYTVKKHGEFYIYTPGSQFNKIIAKLKSILKEKEQALIQLVDLIVPMKTQQAEIFATVYAAWNNLLIDDVTISDEAIVFEARENWHIDKLKIPREKFFGAIDWMKKNNIIPKGSGKKVLPKNK